MLVYQRVKATNDIFCLSKRGSDDANFVWAISLTWIIRLDDHGDMAIWQMVKALVATSQQTRSDHGYQGYSWCHFLDVTFLKKVLHPCDIKKVNSRSSQVNHDQNTYKEFWCRAYEDYHSVTSKTKKLEQFAHWQLGLGEPPQPEPVESEKSPRPQSESEHAGNLGIIDDDDDDDDDDDQKIIFSCFVDYQRLTMWFVWWTYTEYGGCWTLADLKLESIRNWGVLSEAWAQNWPAI